MSEKTQYVAMTKTMRCVSGCNAVTLSGHRIGFFEQIYCMGRCRYTATAVEDILNGQRSTAAMGIEICVSKNLGRCTQTSLLSLLIAHCSRHKNLFFCSYVEKYSQLITHLSLLTYIDNACRNCNHQDQGVGCRH